VTEEQVIDADLDDIELATYTDIGLTLLENGKRYCERCAQEVERLMGIGPLVPSAAELADDHDHEDVALEASLPEPENAELPEAVDKLPEAGDDDDGASEELLPESAVPEVVVESTAEPTDDDEACASDVTEPVRWLPNSPRSRRL
jgi:hypothetical protein